MPRNYYFEKNRYEASKGRNKGGVWGVWGCVVWWYMERSTTANLASQIFCVNMLLTSHSSPFLLLYLASGNCFFFMFWFFNSCWSQWKLLWCSLLPPSSPALKHQLFICIYGAQLYTYKIGRCLHGGLESSARNLSPLSCWLSQMGSLMERA